MRKEPGSIASARLWKRQSQGRPRIPFFILVAAVLGLFSQPATAIQKETTAEKAENLEKQVKGGLFNFWDFDKQSPGGVPQGFVALTYGDGQEGLWRIEAEPAAPSFPHAVLAVSACSTCSQLLIAKDLKYEYPDLAVRLHQAGGHGSMGMVFGLRDRMNFYAAMVDLAGKTLRVVRVVDGKETVLGEAPLKMKPVEWHTFRVQRNTIISKDFIETVFDGQLTLSVEDQSLGLGQVGLLVRGDMSVHFDSFHAAPLYSHRPLSPPAAY
ncbi:MAG TPA: hypothetical protein VJ805_08175 [Nitrospiraceae bacterium]|nr:hypothetical protein [Nitrospiraceae bacterium]